jgi:hypothetical protein
MSGRFFLQSITLTKQKGRLEYSKRPFLFNFSISDRQ